MARGDSGSMIELTTKISMRSSAGKRPMGTDDVGYKVIESIWSADGVIGCWGKMRARCVSLQGETGLRGVPRNIVREEGTMQGGSGGRGNKIPSDQLTRVQPDP